MQRPFVPVLFAAVVATACSRQTAPPASPAVPAAPPIAAEHAPPPSPPSTTPETTVETVEELEAKESAFDSNQWNSAIGLSGGAGGRYGGRAGGRQPRPRAADDETYARIVEHGFLPAADDPLSTFAIDVDGASWSNVRRMLEDGKLPPADAVRVEEFVNWFRYGDAAPAADAEHPIAVHTATGPCPWAPTHRLLRVVLRTRDVEVATLAPRNLVFLVDVSGSMADDDKLPLLRRGLRLLVRQMRPQDRIAIVTYAGEARVALEPTSGLEATRIEAAIESLQAGGSTNGGAGILTAYELARRHASAESIDRVVLATDGDFNVGVADREQLIAMIESQRDDGVFLSVLGFGRGNLKDATLEALGRHGNGHYAYVDSIAEARRVLVEQSGATLVTVAKDVKVQIEFNPRFVQSYRQIGYENRALAARDFNDDRKDAGEMGAGHVVTALYELVPVGVEPPTPAVDALRYQDSAAPAVAATDRGDGAAAQHELLTVKVRYKLPQADSSRRFDTFVARDAGGEPDADFRFATAVAAFGMLLRDSDHAGDLTLDAVATLAAGARGDDPAGERAEFARLVGMAKDLRATEPGTR